MTEKGSPELLAAEGIPFSALEHNFYGTGYAERMAHHVVETALLLDLNPEFVPMFRQHLMDTNTIIYRERENVFKQDRNLYVNRLKIDSRGKLLDVSKTDVEATHDPYPFARVLMISEESIKRRKKLLFEVMGSMDVDRSQKTNTALATDWLFYEACADILGNAVHMRQNFVNYIPDFGGHSVATFHTERTISANYLSVVDATHMSVTDDVDEFRRGFGLVLLRNALLAKGAVSSDQQAMWVIQGIRRLPRFRDAHTENEISERLRALVPRDPQKHIGEFALAVCDPSLDEFYRRLSEDEQEN